jgi:hypothetical protein
MKPKTTALQCLIWSSLPFSLSLVSHLKVLGGQQLMGVLGVRIGVIILILRYVKTFQFHVLLGAGRGGFDAGLLPDAGVWLCSLIEAFRFDL